MNRQVHKLKVSQKLRIKRRKAYGIKYAKTIFEKFYSLTPQSAERRKEINIKYANGLQSIEAYRKAIGVVEEDIDQETLDFRQELENDYNKYKSIVDKICDKILKQLTK